MKSLFVIIFILFFSSSVYATVYISGADGRSIEKADLSTALASADASLNTVIVSGSVFVTNNLTIPTDVILKIDPHALITVAQGKSLFINGTFISTANQVFSETSSIIFGAGAVAEVYPEWWGARSNNSTTDSTLAIQSAINSIHVNGGTLKFQAGIYVISKSISIGDGSIAIASKINNIRILGSGIGSSSEIISGNNTGTVIRWLGVPAGICIIANGPIVGLQIHDICIDCNNIASTGLYLMNPQFSSFKNIIIKKYVAYPPTYNQYAIVLDAYKQTTSQYSRGAISNTFEKVILREPGSNSNGIIIGPSVWLNNDSWDVLQSSFVNCTFTANSSSPANNTVALQLQFTDNISFYQCIVSHFSPTNGKALRVRPPTGNMKFPAEISFFHTAIIGGLDIKGRWEPSSDAGIHFNPWPIADGEQVPTAFGLWGVTTQGRHFGGNYSGCILRDSGKSNISVPAGVNHKLHWGQTISDTEGMSSDDNIQPKYTGLYQIGTSIEWAANTTGLRKVSIMKHSKLHGEIELVSDIKSDDTAGATIHNLTVLDEYNDKNDYYYISAYHQSNSGVLELIRYNNSTPRAPKFWAHRIR